MPDGVVTKRRSRLLAVPPESVEPKKPKVLIFGPPGVGKTWASLDFPSVYYIDTEGGADLDHYRAKLRNSGGVYMGPDQGSLDFDTVIGQIQALAVEDHPYRTIVLDSASKLWNVALSDEQEALGEKDNFGAFKKKPTRKFMSMIKWMGRLDMNGVIICHQKDLWGLNEKKQREVIDYTADIEDKLQYDIHLMLRIAKPGEKRYAYIGKSRLQNFPTGDNFEWSYAAFAERYGREVMEKEAKQMVLASPEQLAEVRRLLEIVKVPEDWEEKVFNKDRIESWEEMESIKIDERIAVLKERVKL